jgi:hypothetical protein
MIEGSIPLWRQRAQATEAIGEVVHRAADVDRNTASDCACFLIPTSAGEMFNDAPTPMSPAFRQAIGWVAQAILDSPEAQKIAWEWNALVSPDKDPLRFVRARLP